MEGKRKIGYGHFGVLAKNYSKARRGYPLEVIEYLEKLVKNRDVPVLDLGCGTGISTRQLREKFENIIGADKDKKMLAAARKEKDGIRYIVASAEKLPFQNESFDAVMAFGAFHWFANNAALNEIKRILKTDGIFYIVNKNDVGEFKKGYRKIIEGIIRKSLPNIKKDYSPEKILKEASFKKIKVKNFKATEYFTPKEALDYFQSVSLWNLMPRTRKSEALKNLRAWIASRTIHGFLPRKIEVKAISGVK